METTKVRINSHCDMIFNIDVSGTNELITEVRLTVHDDKKISYIGTYRDGKAIFKLKDLERYFKSGAFKYELEIYIGNQYFVPLSGQIEFTEPIKVIAEQEKVMVSEYEKPIQIEATLEQRSEIKKALIKRLKEVGSSLGVPISDVPTKEELDALVNKAKIGMDKPTPKVAYYIKMGR